MVTVALTERQEAELEVLRFSLSLTTVEKIWLVHQGDRLGGLETKLGMHG